MWHTNKICISLVELFILFLRDAGIHFWACKLAVRIDVFWPIQLFSEAQLDYHLWII